MRIKEVSKEVNIEDESEVDEEELFDGLDSMSED